MLNRAVTLGFVMQVVCPEVRFCQKSRGKCSFWRSGFSLLGNVSWKMLVVEARMSLDVALGKCSF